MFYLHQLTFPEVLDSKKAVVDLQGKMWGGPDRRGNAAPHRDKCFQAWQRAYQEACSNQLRFQEIPAEVHAYYQQTKGLLRAPRESQTLELFPDNVGAFALEMQEAVGGAPPPAKKKHPNPPRFATSYSGIKDFLGCARRWAAAKYWKTLPYIEGPEAKWGNRVHLAFERLITGVVNEEDVKIVKDNDWQKYLVAIFKAKKAGATVVAEKELCFTKALVPCGWKDWNTVWFRFKGDVLIHLLHKLNYIDWKTGKRFSKRGDDQADDLQLKVAWAVCSIYYPEVEEFTGTLIFLQESDLTRAVVKRKYTRADLPAIWAEILAVTNRMEEAWESENFRMQTSGLCKKHCGVTDCPHCGGR